VLAQVDRDGLAAVLLRQQGQLDAAAVVSVVRFMMLAWLGSKSSALRARLAA
jgi:hypothetical protein